MFGTRNPNYNSAIFSPQNSQQSFFNQNPSSMYPFTNPNANSMMQQNNFPSAGLPFGRSQSESTLFRGRGQSNNGTNPSNNTPLSNNQNGFTQSKKQIHKNIGEDISKNDSNLAENFKGKPETQKNPENKIDPNSVPSSPTNPFNQVANNIQGNMQNTFGPQPNNFGPQQNQNNINQSVPNAMIGSNTRQFGSYLGVNVIVEGNKKEDIPEGDEKEEDEEKKEEEHEPHCKYCPRKYNLSKMACEQCVASKKEEQRKHYEQKIAQFQSKSKVDLDEIKRLRKQLSMLQKQNKERQVQHERQIRELKSKVQEEVSHGDSLLNTITKLNDVVRVHENFQEECRLITQENQEGWKKIYTWAEKFNLFTDRLLEKVPEKANQINKIMIKQEENVIFTLQEKLSKIPKDLIEIIEKVQQDKKVELDCMKEAEQQVITVLENQKVAFENSKIPFPQITMTLALEPFKSSVASLDISIKELEELKSECVLFSIFNVDICSSKKNQDISKSKYPISKQKKEKEESSKKSEAEVMQPAEPVETLDEGSNQDEKVKQ